MEDTDEEDLDAQVNILDNHAAQLMEHFEAVQILATSRTKDETFTFHRGRGNVYARIGLAQEYLDRMREETRIDQRRKSEQ